MPDIKRLMAALSHDFHAPSLLIRALTHPSVGSDNNQRLEFLGDAVLQLCVSDRIFSSHPIEREGTLTQIRQHLVREEALADVARSLHLSDYLILDRSIEISGGRNQSSVLADAMEAVLAAVYLDGGLACARDLVDRLWGRLGEASEIDAKSALQARLQAQGKEAPTYRTLSEEGPPHDRVFTVAAMIGGREASRGTGTSKKRAEQQAAQIALNQMKRSGE